MGNQPHVCRREIAEVHLDIEYRCSSCGKLTHGVSLCQAAVYSNFLPKGVADHSLPLEKVAFDKLDRKLDLILDKENADRYEAADLRCSCSFCGHKEPWTGMHYDKVDYVIRLLSMWGSFISVPFLLLFLLVLLPSTKGTPRQFSNLFTLFAIAAMILAATWLLRVFRRQYKQWHRRKLHRAILQLPQESLPRITFDPSDKKIASRYAKYVDRYVPYFLTPDGVFKL